MTKQDVLRGALSLNNSKCIVTIDNDCIITTVNWYNIVGVAPNAIDDTVKTFKFVVRLNDNNTWSELDEYGSNSKGASFSGAGMGSSYYRGEYKAIRKGIKFGKNRNNGNTGVVSVSFNSEDYKRPVRDYLIRCGYTKAKRKLFDRLFGRL